jgi:hypothetical protein
MQWSLNPMGVRPFRASTCALAITVAAALPLLTACDPPIPAGTWAVVAGPFEGMLYSVWGLDDADLWAVGGCDVSVCPAGARARILHGSGASFAQAVSPVDEVLWWVHGFAADDVWMAGEHGAVLHWDGKVLRSVPAPPSVSTGSAFNVKLFGVWGAGPRDVWIVGGVPDFRAVVLRWNGQELVEVTDAPTPPGTWYKVWGSAADDVYLVGQFGAIAHFDGAGWQVPDLAGAGVTREPLFTVSARSRSDVYVVGGQPGQGVAIHFDGRTFSAVASIADSAALAAGLTGVFAGAGSDVAMTGFGGARLLGRSGVWRDESTDGLGDLDLHGVWFDSLAVVYAAGGHFFAGGGGVLVRRAR